MKISDRVILSILAGSVSAAIANVFGYLSKFLYPGTIVMSEAAAGLFVNILQVHSPLGLIAGNVWSLIVGVIHAFAFVLLLDYTGWKYLWWKGLAVTNVGWLLGAGLVVKALNIGSAWRDDITSYFLWYLAHLLYLTISAYIVGKYGVAIENLQKIKSD